MQSSTRRTVFAFSIHPSAVISHCWLDLFYYLFTAADAVKFSRSRDRLQNLALAGKVITMEYIFVIDTTTCELHVSQDLVHPKLFFLKKIHHIKSYNTY